MDKRKLVLTLCIEEGAEQHQHSFVEVEIILKPGYEVREVQDAVQRAACNAFDIIKESFRGV